jgi:hypothetical protein
LWPVLTALPSTARSEEMALPSFRILPDGWGDGSQEHMREVIISAMKVLWPYFPKRRLEPFVIQHVETVPMVHFERTVRKEIIMDLATMGNLWSQLAYQFAHEFCHILCQFDQDGRGNLWFEETLCETASLFTLRHMATNWKTAAPHPDWRPYSASLTDYAETVIKGRTRLTLEKLPDYYQQNSAILRENPTERSRNGAMAAALLELFERQPEHWESITWLNSSPSPPDETFSTYLTKWLRAVPARHQVFVAKLRATFGIE